MEGGEFCRQPVVGTDSHPPKVVHVLDDDRMRDDNDDDGTESCASSVTMNCFQGAELFMGPMYPSLQTVQEVAEVDTDTKINTTTAAEATRESVLKLLDDDETDGHVVADTEATTAKKTVPLQLQDQAAQVLLEKRISRPASYASGIVPEREVEAVKLAAAAAAAGLHQTPSKIPNSAGLVSSASVSGSSITTTTTTTTPTLAFFIREKHVLPPVGGTTTTTTIPQHKQHHQPPPSTAGVSGKEKSQQPQPQQQQQQQQQQHTKAGTDPELLADHSNNTGADGRDSVVNISGIPGAFAAGGIFSSDEHSICEIDSSSSCCASSDCSSNMSEHQQQAHDDDDNDANENGLVRAKPVLDDDDSNSRKLGASLPIATPQDDAVSESGSRTMAKTSHPQCYYWWPLILTLGGILLVVVAGAVVVGGVCGSGHCSSPKLEQDGNMNTTTTTVSHRSTLTADFQERIMLVMGSSYFDDEHNDTFVSDARAKALNWIVNEDPLQLGIDSDHLVQRYLLASFYYQTTRNYPWRACNPPEENQGSTCFLENARSDQSGTSVYGTQWSRWLSDTHECFWAGLNCVGQGMWDVTDITLQYNQLNGHLPTELAALQQITSLNFYRNELSGEIPPSLASLPLSEIYFHENMFEGTIPTELFGSSLLKFVLLTQNLLSGSIPQAVKEFQGMSLMLDENILTGSIPSEVFGMPNIRNLPLENNLFTGTLPTQVGIATDLRLLHVGSTSLSGVLPSELGQLSVLQLLQLHHTQMQGSIPEELYSGMTHLQVIAIEKCNFAGTISTEIGHLTYLEAFLAANNDFHGTIPSETSGLPHLYDIQLNGNNFSGTFPDVICQTRYGKNSWGPFGNNLVADCYPDKETGVPLIFCACCTVCCDAETGVCYDM